MQSVNSRFVLSFTQISYDEVVSMPLVFGPPRRSNVRPRRLGHLRSDKLPIDKQLDLDALPRIGIVNGPARDTSRFDDGFTPTMKRWRK
mgnify:CR=1 FL=1